MNDPKLRSVFEKHDVDGGGQMSTTELRGALAELKVSVTPAELHAIVLANDADNSGELSFEEFSTIFEASKLRSVFSEIDSDGSGQINTEELGKALDKLGYKLPKSEIAKILTKVDKDESGEVSFDEFHTFFKYVPAASLATIAKMWVDQFPVDVGSDLAPPTPSADVPWWYGVLGGIGGVTSRTLTAPLEKIKLQAQTSGGNVNIAKELSKTYKELGLRGLFAGNAANCARVFPYAGIVTVVYLNALTLTPADNELDPMEPLYRGSCAATAGVVGQLFTYPIDVIRARLTVDPSKHTSILGCAKTIMKESGTSGLYRGLIPTLCAVAPFLAFQMSTADALKSVCASNNVEVTPLFMGAIGGTAGIVAQTVVYPLDVLRRRMQVQGGGGNANVISDSTWVAMRQVVQKEGFRSLFSGLIPTYIKVMPAVAIAMTTTKELIGFSKRNWE
ncbi:hypothetical protein TrCOL_g1582 [Triparma columacea]|uniref:EF-hand domain-containing protein n=1 Tax=Triparma columacea TaxID=722753 RepID=A0A9W7LCD1_9STRA|nr:hypothetical protein TrCOL_g1582 [Triparma columacea]